MGAGASAQDLAAAIEYASPEQLRETEMRMNGLLRKEEAPSTAAEGEAKQDGVCFGPPDTWVPHLNSDELSDWGSVTNINLFRKGLTGTIPAKLPASLIELHLNSNQLTGSIPTSWPSSLESLSLSHN